MQLHTPEAAAASLDALRALLAPTGAHAAARVVRVRLQLPRVLPQQTPGYQPECRGVRALLQGAQPGWAEAVERFCRRCSELTDRDKRHKRECTNQC